MADSLIAGIVAIHRGTLLTRNGRHFSRIPDFDLEAL
jgi:predicted nucleic acid-binding protein